MQRLSGTDSLFLAGETPTWHQHVGGLVIVDPTGAPGFGFDELYRTIATRLPLVPKLTWKLKGVPLGLDRAVWVDDPAFDLHRHIHRLTVPPPGGPRETADAIAPIMSRQLNRRFPLWELWYLDGLVCGRAAVLMKFHHCLLDGGAGSVLASLLLDLEPAPPPVPVPETIEPQPAPSDLRLFFEALLPATTAPLRAMRYGLRLTRRGVHIGRHVVSHHVSPDLGTMLRAPKTSFNASIGPRRSMAFSSVSIADIHALRQRFGVKFNDVALALCAGALRSYLIDRDELPSRPLSVGIPVSTRNEGDASLGNQLSYIAVPLPTNIADPEERLHAVVHETQAAKSVYEAMRERSVGSIADTAPPFMIGALLRLAYQSHVLGYIPGMMNTIVSNVPGPPMDLYIAGARLTGIYSASVLLDQMGVNITLYSFGNRVDFGVHVDPDLISEPWAIANAIPRALADMMQSGGLGEPSPIEDPFGLTANSAPVERVARLSDTATWAMR
jgi:diacylglycerol O-acyltransferase / wax synthase